MTFDEYSQEAWKTVKYHPGTTKSKLYTALGLCSEAGEAGNLIKKHMHSNTTDTAALVDELGDVLWYIAAICLEYGLSFNHIAISNLKKLEQRHRPIPTKESQTLRMEKP